MSVEKKFITGIYNYCDYICEKCVFTQRCYLFWAENNADEHDRELEIDFDELADMAEGLEEYSTKDEPKHPLDDRESAREEKRTQEIIAPSFKIIEMLDPIVENIAEPGAYPAHINEALELVLENYLLITVKYYRAVHQTTFEPSDILDEIEVYNYVDTEKTLLALKSFNWNLRSGLNVLQKYFKQYTDEFVMAMNLSRQIESRIDEELLPATRLILQKYSHHLDDEDTL